MAYTPPRNLVFQDLQSSPLSVATRRRACIIGPNAHLVRYSIASEKDRGALGAYEPVAGDCYDWPDRPAGGLVDEDFTQLFVEKGKLLYFEDLIGQDESVLTVANHANRVRCATLVFKTGNGYDHSDAFLDRGVKVGDAVNVRAVVGSDVYSKDTFVQDFVADVTPAVIGSSSGDADNAITQTAASRTSGDSWGSAAELIDKAAGPDNCVTLEVDATNYDGRVDGWLTDTYTVTVLESSADEDFTTATIRVSSASGEDNDLTVTPAAAGASFTVGVRGLLLTFDLDTGGCSSDADTDGVQPNDLTAGQKWVFDVRGAFTAPTHSASGSTYDGEVDATYIVEVSRGGLFADTIEPQIRVTTDNGSDVSGPTTVSTTAVAVAVGTQGVQIAFTGTGLRKGDRYTIPVTAATDGAIRTLVLSHSLDSAIPASTDVDLKLYLYRDVEIPRNREGFAPLVNFETSSTELCVIDGIQLYDSQWTDDGVEQPLPLKAGNLFVSARYWVSDVADDLHTATTVSLTTIPGSIEQPNPLKYGVSRALAASGGASVGYIAVADPTDIDSWAFALSKVASRIEIYNLVALTRDPEILNLVAAQVNERSSPEAGRWRAMFVSLAGSPEKVILDATISTDEEEVLATLADDPNTSGTQYTLLTVPTANSDFLTNGVRAGDIVRFLYTTDGFGGEAYTSFTVDAVLSEDQLRLRTGHTVAVNTPQKIEIWRTLTAAEECQAIALKGGAWGSTRVCAVWPETIESGGEEIEGYFLCCTLAGLRAGVRPHQGLTNYPIPGYDSVPQTTRRFNEDELNVMAEAGVWIVTQDPVSGQIFTRHALTTAGYGDVVTQEEMIRVNADDISYQFLDLFNPYIGVKNATDRMAHVIETDADAKIGELISTQTEGLGGQMVEGSQVESVERSLVNRDRFLLNINAILPAPLNNIETHLLINV